MPGSVHQFTTSCLPAQTTGPAPPPSALFSFLHEDVGQERERNVLSIPSPGRALLTPARAGKAMQEEEEVSSQHKAGKQLLGQSKHQLVRAIPQPGALFSPGFIVVSQKARRGLDFCLEDGSDRRLKGCFRVQRAKSAEVVGSQQEPCCILHGRHIQVAEIKHAEQRERSVKWDQVRCVRQSLIN